MEDEVTHLKEHPKSLTKLDLVSKTSANMPMLLREDYSKKISLRQIATQSFYLT